jgi:hypothetical protein
VYIDSIYVPPDASEEGSAGSLKWTTGHNLGDSESGPLAETLLPLYSEVRSCLMSPTPTTKSENQDGSKRRLEGRRGVSMMT